MTDYSPRTRKRVNRRLDRRNEAKRQRADRARRVIERLKAGAVLHRLHQHNRTIWCLVWRGGSEFLTHEQVTDALATGRIVGVGDALPFAGAELSQTFRYTSNDQEDCQ